MGSMTKPPPARIKGSEIERYYLREQLDKRTANSERCDWWLERIRAGWRPSRHLRSQGYYCKAQYFGVYVAEWLFILSPALDAAEKVDAVVGRKQPRREKRLLCEPLNPPKKQVAASV